MSTRTIKKPVRIDPSLEVFKITTAPLTPIERKDSRQHLTEEDDDLLENLMKMLRTNPKTVSSEDCEYFRELEKLRLKYPRNPVILNYLAIGYQHLNQIDKSRALIFETCEKFPDYLFGLTAKAGLLLQENKIEEAFKTVKNSLTIKQLYPHRDVFHSTEVKVFQDILVRYFFLKGDLEKAEYHFKLIEKIALELLENPNDSVFVHTRFLLQSGKGLWGFLKKRR
jgi:tetratricopeptide (TPR) repeat protein